MDTHLPDYQKFSHYHQSGQTHNCYQLDWHTIYFGNQIISVDQVVYLLPLHEHNWVQPNVEYALYINNISAL